MSKSDPLSAIFMEDTEEEIREKIAKAYCAPGIIENNPILDYTKHIIFAQMNFTEFKVPREIENDVKTYMKFEDLLADYQSEKLYPKDLKRAVADSINQLLEPVRRHFKENVEAKELLLKVKELLEEKAKQEEKEKQARQII